MNGQRKELKVVSQTGISIVLENKMDRWILVWNELEVLRRDH